MAKKGYLETAGDFWAEYFGLSRKGKTAKKRMKLREAKKLQRQAAYAKSNKVGNKAVKNQRRKKRQMDRIAKGED